MRENDFVRAWAEARGGLIERIGRPGLGALYTYLKTERPELLEPEAFNPYALARRYRYHASALEAVAALAPDAVDDILAAYPEPIDWLRECGEVIQIPDEGDAVLVAIDYLI